MRVLHLAPPARQRTGLTAHTFIDEEILALRDRGLDCVLLSDTLEHSERRQGVEIVAVASPRTRRERREAAADVVRTLRVRPDWRLDAESRHARRVEAIAAQTISRCRIDLVHSHFGWPDGFGGAVAAAMAGVPLIASLRGMDLLRDDSIGYGLRKRAAFRRNLSALLVRASRTVYATEFMRDRGLQLGARPEGAMLVRKGTDLDRFTPAPDRRAACAPLQLTPPVILAVGTLQQRKGYHTLIRAMEVLRDRPWTLVLCGDGSERQALQRQAAAAGLTSRVRFAGTVARSEMPAYFGAADVFVHAAVLEAAGNVILEALASGCPIVTTDCGGPAEYVVPGKTGFIVPVGDHRAIADRVGQLLSDDGLRARISRAARNDAEEHYSYARMIAELTSVYETALRGAPPRHTRASHAAMIAG
jgi:glycosyltransferase involved in cell wall biosynthesis